MGFQNQRVYFPGWRVFPVILILLLLLAVFGLVGLVIGAWSLISLQKEEE